MEQQTLIRSLQGIGLDAKEAAVYIATLSLESATAYRIAEVSREKRPTVYVVLEELRRKGLILKTPHPKKALFSARPLGEYLAEEEYRLAQVHTLLPHFEALRKQPDTAVYFYSGLSGMRDALHYKFKSMSGRTYLSLYCNLAGVHRSVTDLYDAWDKEAIAAGVRFQVIRARGKKQSADHLSSNERRAIEERYIDAASYPSNISFEIADDFIRITDAKALFATVIESRETATALRLAVSIIWNMAKP